MRCGQSGDGVTKGRSRFTDSAEAVRWRPLFVIHAKAPEAQIISVLKEHEAGAKTTDLARKHGVSEATLYNWQPSSVAWTCPGPNG